VKNRVFIILFFVLVGVLSLVSCSKPEPRPFPLPLSQTEEVTPTIETEPDPTQIRSISPSHDFTPANIVHDQQFWNADWDAGELWAKIWSVNREYRKTHTYIEDVFDCDNMTLDLWNILHEQVITSIIVVGNLDLDEERFRECNHTWLLIQHTNEGSSYYCYIIESTNGEVYSFDLKTKEFAQYIEGYYYSSPSNFLADNKERL
jgi:hypothetical protein